ncbi:MAG: methyltransferase domain-containing protein [Candidatus Absconditabacteria bacterium]
MNYCKKFELIYNKILDYIKTNNTDFYSFPDKKFKLPISDAIFCLEDKIRTYKFYLAIENYIETVKKEKDNLIVVDAGSGTGVLGIFTLYLGAGECIFLENNPYSLLLSQNLATKLGYYNCEFILADATNIKLHKKYDLLISETIEANLYNEDFTKIINNLTQFGNKNSEIIPQKVNVKIFQETDTEKIEIFAYEFDCKQGFQRRNIFLTNESVINIYVKIDLVLFNQIVIKSGESPYFLNEKTFDYKNLKHPIFKFY